MAEESVPLLPNMFRNLGSLVFKDVNWYELRLADGASQFGTTRSTLVLIVFL